MQHLDQSKAIKKAADEFLILKNIEEMLAKYGNVLYAGSYSTDLMVWHDIDIQLILKPKQHDIEVFAKLTKEILMDQDVKSIKLINSIFDKNTKKPKGIYMGIEYNLQSNNDKWKVDIWSLSEKDLIKDRELHNKIIAKSSPAIRSLILKLKFDLMGKSERVPTLASYYIYQAIFIEDILDENLILEHLKTNGIIL